MIRALSVALLLLSLTVPAFAAAPAPAQPAPQRGLVARAARGVGGFIARQFRMRDEMKASLVEAKTLRKDGELTAAAETLRDAPKASGLWERFRAWRAKKAVMRAARKELRVKKLDADPGQGLAAMQTFDHASMSSWIDRRRADKATQKGAVNAIKIARKLGNRGRYDDALDKIEWSLGERETMDPRTQALVQRLYGQAMKSSDRAATRFVKSRDPKDKQDAYNEAVETMGLAHHFDQLQAKAGGESIFDTERAQRIGQRMGLDTKKLDAALGGGDIVDGDEPAKADAAKSDAAKSDSAIIPAPTIEAAK